MCKHGKALSFDGSSDKVLVNDSSMLRVSNNFTLSLWFKPSSTTQSNKYILSRNNSVGTNQSAIIYEYVNDQVEFYATGYTGSDPRTGSQIPIIDTNWHNITYSYNGTTWAGYLDGVNVFSTSRTFGLSTVVLDGWYLGSACYYRLYEW